MHIDIIDFKKVFFGSLRKEEFQCSFYFNSWSFNSIFDFDNSSRENFDTFSRAFINLLNSRDNDGKLAI